MDFASWLPCFPVLFHLGSSLLPAAAHIWTHPEVCFPDLNLTRLTVKENYCVCVVESAQFPKAVSQDYTGEI